MPQPSPAEKDTSISHLASKSREVFAFAARSAGPGAAGPGAGRSTRDAPEMLAADAGAATGCGTPTMQTAGRRGWGDDLRFTIYCGAYRIRITTPNAATRGLQHRSVANDEHDPAEPSCRAAVIRLHSAHCISDASQAAAKVGAGDGEPEPTVQEEGSKGGETQRQGATACAQIGPESALCPQGGPRRQRRLRQVQQLLRFRTWNEAPATAMSGQATNSRDLTFTRSRVPGSSVRTEHPADVCEGGKGTDTGASSSTASCCYKMDC